MRSTVAKENQVQRQVYEGDMWLRLRLAHHFAITLRELDERMTSDELTLWGAWYEERDRQRDERRKNPK